ncbi:MAG: Sensor protein ZraS [Proteobacteria bacterium]|nr:Sensor protein ZraS [Pseudomonadota bacterium]
MLALLNHLSIRNRIWGIVAIFIGSIIAGSAVDIVMLKKTLQQEKESTIRQVVENGYSVVAHYEALQRSGQLDRQTAQTAALSAVKGMRYNGQEYFWINDDQTPARMLMHPIASELDGLPLLDAKFNCATALRSGTEGPFTPTDGKKNLTEAFAEAIAKTGDGYVTYRWSKALPGGGTTPAQFPKLSYVKKFAPWGWVIGSGIYVDDIDAAIYKRATQFLMLWLGAGALLLLLASLIARSITHPLRATMQAMHGIARGEAGLDQRLAVEGHSEIGELAGHFNEMLDQLQSRDLALLKHQAGLEREVSSRTASLQEANRQLDAELAERRQAEQALQDSEEQFRGIASVAQDAIITINERGEITFWNPAAEKIFGYRREQALGRDMHALIAPERFYAAYHHGKQQFVLSGQGPAVGRTLELTARRQDGQEFPIELSLSAIFLHGAWSSVGIVRDISERKRQEKEQQENFAQVRALNERLENAQNQLLQAEKMASIGQLAAGVAHEINNPIGFISSNLGTLKTYVDDLLDIVHTYSQAESLLTGQGEILSAIQAKKEQADLDFLSKDVQVLLKESRDGIVRVTKIVKDLKDFSRIDSEDWGEADLERGLDNTLNIVWNQIKHKADIVKEYGALPAVECLGSQLNQVFMNLLLNAAQAIETHGTISLRTGCSGDRVWVEIADTGRGISPENQKRIFDPFFTTRAIGQGTGLGLSLAYSIVRKHHGKLEVQSEVGRGSCFRIELPCHQPNPVDAVAELAES